MSELRVQELRFTFDPLKYAVERERERERDFVTFCDIYIFNCLSYNIIHRLC